jgi:hypothetical protein
MQYLCVPTHITDAYDPRRDPGAVHFRGRRVERQGKRLAPVKNLDYSAVERPDLKATDSGK